MAVATPLLLRMLALSALSVLVFVPAHAAAAANSSWSVVTVSGQRHHPGVRVGGGAAVTSNPLLVLRSGGPNTTSTATLSALLRPGVTLDGLSFSYRFETGYGEGAGVGCGAQFNVTAAGKTAFASPMMSGYPYANKKDPSLYSPRVPVEANDLGVQVTPSNQEVFFTFHNLCRNVQLLLPIAINISCTGGPCLAAPPPPPPPLPPLNIDPTSITISGISSGADFVVNLHVAHSKTVSGVGVFAGQAYHCSVTRFPSDPMVAANPSVPVCDGCPPSKTLGYDHCKQNPEYVRFSFFFFFDPFLPLPFS